MGVDSTQQTAPFQAAPTESDRAHMNFLFVCLRTSVREARFGVAQEDMEIIVDMLNRLDQLIDLAGAPFGLTPAPSRESQASSRNSDTAPPPTPAPKDDRASGHPFHPGSIWCRPDGRKVLVVSAIEHGAVLIQWYLNGRFRNYGRFRIRDLVVFSTENELRPEGRRPGGGR